MFYNHTRKQQRLYIKPTCERVDGWSCRGPKSPTRTCPQHSPAWRAPKLAVLSSRDPERLRSVDLPQREWPAFNRRHRHRWRFAIPIPGHRWLVFIESPAVGRPVSDPIAAADAALVELSERRDEPRKVFIGEGANQ